jgi:hypothetical protein
MRITVNEELEHETWVIMDRRNRLFVHFSGATYTFMHYASLATFFNAKAEAERWINLALNTSADYNNWASVHRVTMKVEDEQQ